MASAARWILVRIAAKKLSSLVCQKYCSNAVCTSHGTATSRGHVTLTTYHTPCLDECTVRPTEDNDSWTRMISTCPLQVKITNSQFCACVTTRLSDRQTDRQTCGRTWTGSLALNNMIDMNASTSLATRSHGRARWGRALVTAPISFSCTWILRISSRCLWRHHNAATNRKLSQYKQTRQRS